MKTVTILYKSGAKVQVTCKSMTVTRYSNGTLHVKWDEMKPVPLLLGVDDIAAIYEGKV